MRTDGQDYETESVLCMHTVIVDNMCGFFKNEYIQDLHDQNMMLGRPNRRSCAMLPTSSACSEFHLPSSCRQHTLTRTTAFCDERVGTPIQGLVSHPSSIRRFSTFLSHIRVQPMDTGSSTESQCCGLLAHGNLIQTLGQSSSER